MVSQYMSNPGKEHWNAVKWILRYMKGTTNMCLRFGSGKPELDGFTYSDICWLMQIPAVLQHWNEVKWILRYLKGTTNICL